MCFVVEPCDKYKYIKITIKMHFILKICFLYLLSVVEGQAQQAGPFDKLAEYYYYKCWNTTRNEKIFAELNKDGTELQDRLKFSFELLPEGKKYFCNEQRKLLEGLMQKFSADLETCLPEPEKYIADFLKKSGEEFLHFFCHNNGENLDRIFSTSPTSQQCKDSLSSSVTSTELASCFSRIFKPMSSYVKKQELCDDVTIAKKCVIQLVNDKCPRSDNYQKLSSEFFRYISKPCSGCVFSLSTLLIIASVTISWIFSH
ncbi:unnamed protein product [Callosobruchus maculatus]|uniref:Uncharacterized protein n=1 Tax=Callosobruchus maculatus TaxID=64391 RepID=A0A653D6U1_CALMS|nr:unnamed protein product [Callosobruchus maculatus]